MLTERERRHLTLVLRACCKSYLLPFSWENDKMSLEVNRNIIMCNSILWILLISTTIFQVLQIPTSSRNKDINGLILHGVVLLYSLTNVFYKMIIWLFKAELVQLMNQVFHINSSWGKTIIFKLICLHYSKLLSGYYVFLNPYLVLAPGRCAAAP